MWKIAIREKRIANVTKVRVIYYLLSANRHVYTYTIAFSKGPKSRFIQDVIFAF